MSRSITALGSELRVVREGSGLEVDLIAELVAADRVPILTSLAVPTTEGEVAPLVAAQRIAVAIGEAISRMSPLDTTLASSLFRNMPGDANRGISAPYARSRTWKMSPVQERQWRDQHEPALLDRIARKLEQMDFVATAPLAPLLVTEDPYARNPIRVFDIIHNTAVHVCGPQRIPVSTRSERTVKALEDGIDVYVFEERTTGNIRRTVRVTKGGMVVRTLEPAVYGFNRHLIKLDAYLNTNDTHDLVIESRLDDVVASPRPFYGVIADKAIPSVTVRVEFDPAALPTRVLVVASPTSSFPLGGEPPALAHLDQRHSHETSYKDLVAGWAYGYLWEW